MQQVARRGSDNPNIFKSSLLKGYHRAGLLKTVKKHGGMLLGDQKNEPIVDKVLKKPE